jgi:hypothetical protein
VGLMFVGRHPQPPQRQQVHEAPGPHMASIGIAVSEVWAAVSAGHDGSSAAGVSDGTWGSTGSASDDDAGAPAAIACRSVAAMANNPTLTSRTPVAIHSSTVLGLIIDSLLAFVTISSEQHGPMQLRYRSCDLQYRRAHRLFGAPVLPGFMICSGPYGDRSSLRRANAERK